MANATVNAAAQAAVLACLAVADAIDAGSYQSRREVESAIGSARELVQAAIDAVLVDYPMNGATAVARLRTLAARLLDVNVSNNQGLDTQFITLTSERSVIDLALELYTDGLRADEILNLNRQIRRPWAIPAGTTLEVYVE